MEIRICAGRNEQKGSPRPKVYMTKEECLNRIYLWMYTPNKHLVALMNENRTNTKGLSNPEPERNPVGALAGSVPGEAKSRPRVTVSIVRCSTRSLDPDNLVGSVKAIVDQLRKCHLIE